MENIKLLATFELVAFLTLILAWGNDVYHRYDYSTTDGGWTTSYRYNVKARSLAYVSTYAALAVAVLGFLVGIWA